MVGQGWLSGARAKRRRRGALRPGRVRADLTRSCNVGEGSLGLESTCYGRAAVRHAYRRWAPVYDFTFGQIAEAGRKHAVKIINSRKGRVLEVGVGTGLSLPCYGSHLTLTGIDLSPEMLDKAREKVERRGLDNIAGLHEMDAGALAFPDESFDTVVAMYVMTVVPEPERVMRELERVCAAGGEVILVNHFSEEEGRPRLVRAKARTLWRSPWLAACLWPRPGARVR